MFKLIEFLKKRPSDNAILISRIIFGLLIIILLWVFFNDYKLNLPQTLKWSETYIKYGLFILWLVPIFMWATNICLAKRKYVRIIQLIFWVILIIVWNNIVMNQTLQPNQTQNTSWSANFENLTQNVSNKTPVNVGFWIALLSIFPLLAWITGKCITSKCLKYWEVIIKIRV